MVPLLTVLALLSTLLALWQAWAARRFRLNHEGEARACADAQSIARPPSSTEPAVTRVSILKPLCGADRHTAACLRSWMTQNLQLNTQVLFGAANADDPALDLARGLAASTGHPNVDVRACRLPLGTNPKVSTLLQLEPHIQGDIVVVSDADVLAPPHLLESMVQLLQDPRTGLVHCFYRLANPENVAMKWEAVSINADFWTQVLQAQSLGPITFALGAVVAMRRTTLQELGGFRALSDFLADDYQLGRRVTQSGKQLAFCPIVVDCFDPPRTWRQVWSHQVRWARTIRVCNPAPFFLSILANATLWPLLLFLSHRSLFSAVLLLGALAFRILTAQHHQRRLAPNYAPAPPWMVPLKDLLNTVVWFCAFMGRSVTWRGEQFRVERDGRMTRIEVVPSVTTQPCS